MATTATDPKQQAHELIDRMAPGQVSAVVGLLEIMLDPFARALANAAYDDEPVSDDERHPAAERGTSVPHEEVLAEFGLTTEDFEQMGRTPPESGDADH